MRYSMAHFGALSFLVLFAACSDDGESNNQTTHDLPIPDGRIAYWAFDEGSGTTANDTQGTHHGTLENGPTWVEGRAGQGIEFDGVDDFVSIPDSNAFDFGGEDWTISAWFRTTSDKDHHVVNLRQDDNDPHIELYIAPPEPFGVLGTHLLPGGVRIRHDGQVNDGAWHHAAISLQNGTPDGYRLYLDGEVVGQDTYSGDELRDWDTVKIGDGPAGQRAFEGTIDEVMIFDRALSGQEMQQVYDHASRDEQ